MIKSSACIMERKVSPVNALSLETYFDGITCISFIELFCKETPAHAKQVTVKPT